MKNLFRLTALKILVLLILLFVTEGFTTLDCGTEQTINLCEKIRIDPDYLDTIQNDTTYVNFSEFGRSQIPKMKQLIKQSISKKYKTKVCMTEEFSNYYFLKYRYSGYYFTDLSPKDEIKIAIEFVFSKRDGKWKLFQVASIKECEKANAFPPGHNDIDD